MHAIVAAVINSTVESVVKISVDYLFRGNKEPSPAMAPSNPVQGATGEKDAFLRKELLPPMAPSDPVEDAIGVMDAFLRAVAARDMDGLTPLCDGEWAMRPETAELLDHTFAAAAPLSWAFKEVLAPEGWDRGKPLAWVIAELAVTFDVGGRYEVIPAVLRTIPTRAGWRVDHLEWAEPAEPEPVPDVVDLNDWFSRFGLGNLQNFPEAPPVATVIKCARCGQKLRVPTDKGRLRVTCRKCTNVQWFEP